MCFDVVCWWYAPSDRSISLCVVVFCCFFCPHHNSAKVPLSSVQSYTAAAAEKYRTQTNMPAFVEAMRAAAVLIAAGNNNTNTNTNTTAAVAATSVQPTPAPTTSLPIAGTSTSSAVYYAAPQPQAHSQFQAVHNVPSNPQLQQSTAAASATVPAPAPTTSLSAPAGGAQTSPAKPVQQQQQQPAGTAGTAGPKFTPNPNHNILSSPIKQNETLPTPGELSPLLMPARPSGAVSVRASPSSVGMNFSRASLNPLLSPSMSGVTTGTRIQLRSPDTIHHKLRDYAYTAATVIEIPMHPNTWFGVRLHDGTTVKIRKSAFDVVNPNAINHESSIPALSLAAAAAGGSRTVSGAGNASTIRIQNTPSAAASAAPRMAQTSAPVTPALPPLPVVFPIPTANAGGAGAGAAPSNILQMLNPQQQQPQPQQTAFFGVPMPLPVPLLFPPVPVTVNQPSTATAGGHNQQQQQQQQQQFDQYRLQQQIAYNAAAAAHHAGLAAVHSQSANSLSRSSTPNTVRDDASDAGDAFLPELDDEQRPASPNTEVVFKAPTSLTPQPHLQQSSQPQQQRPKSVNTNQSSGASTVSKPKRPSSTNPSSKGSGTGQAKTANSKNLVGRYVMVESGRYKGEVGFVTRGGNGYFNVQFIGDVPGVSAPINRFDRARSGNFVMKRLSDLRIVHNLKNVPAVQFAPEVESDSERPIKRIKSQPSPSPFGGDVQVPSAAAIGAEYYTAPPVAAIMQQTGTTPSGGASMLMAPPAPVVVVKTQQQQTGHAYPAPANQAPKKRRPTPSPAGAVHLSSMSLTKQSAESWIDRRVLIKMGKYANQIGTILRSGHGFYCVAIPGRGEVQKRANELALVDESAAAAGGSNAHVSHVSHVSSHHNSSAAYDDADSSSDADIGSIDAIRASSAAPADLSDAASILLHLMKDKSPSKKRRHSSIGSAGSAGPVAPSDRTISVAGTVYQATTHTKYKSHAAADDAESSDDEHTPTHDHHHHSQYHSAGYGDVYDPSNSAAAAALSAAAGGASSNSTVLTIDRDRHRRDSQPFFFPSGTGESRFFVM